MKIIVRYFMLLAVAILLFGSCLAKENKVNKSKLKFHPGHYVAVGIDFDVSEIKYLDEPAVIGVNKRYNWRDIEPTKDVYDFSSIEKDLEYLAKHNKQLVVFLIDRSFWIKGAMPGYLSEYELKAAGGGFTPLRWYPQVKERFAKLGQEIGKRFDSHPNFEGVALQESSLDLRNEDYQKYHYTVSQYRDALIYVLISLQKAMPQSHVFWYGNFMDQDDRMGSNVRKIVEKIEDYEVFWGGPDILPYHKGYNESSYPLYEKYKNRLTLFCCAQDDSYRHHKNDFSHEVEEPMPKEGYLTMEEIFLFARDSLHIRYLFWNYFYEEAKEGQRTYDDAIKVIRKYPYFNNSLGPLGDPGNQGKIDTNL
jgi:hypothetical protein